MFRYFLLLALVTGAAGIEPVAAAPKLYDMDRQLNERNPLDAPQPVAQPTPPSQPGSTPAPGAFRSTLYDMDSLLNQRNPFDTSPVPAAPRARPAEMVQAPSTPPRDVPQAPVPPPAGDPDFPDIYGPDSDEIPGIGDLDGRDPLEPLNRGIFAFNEFVYKNILTPLARGYNKVVPEPIRNSLDNVLSNLNGPVVFANDILQGEFRRAGDTGARFLINSTLGVLGTADVADDLGFQKHSEDFGQTLGVWGMNEGFYLVLPLLGPSNPRDAVGKLLIDGYFDPLGYYLDATDNEEYGYVRSGVSGFTEFTGIVDDLDNLRETSVDFYGALRSLYRQRRAAQIRNQEQGAVPALGGR